MRMGEPRFMATNGAGASHSIWQNNITQDKEKKKEETEDLAWRRAREREQLAMLQNAAEV